jgi:hypothetical protein
MIESYGFSLSCFDKCIEIKDDKLSKQIEKLLLDNIEKLEFYDDTSTMEAVESALNSAYNDMD